MWFRQDWKNFFFMKVISLFSPSIPLKTFLPSNSKSSYLIDEQESMPTVSKAVFEKFPVASVFIPWYPRHPAKSMDLWSRIYTYHLLSGRSCWIILFIFCLGKMTQYLFCLEIEWPNLGLNTGRLVDIWHIENHFEVELSDADTDSTLTLRL